MSFFQKVVQIKEKAATAIVKHKPHRSPREKRKLPLVKKAGFWKVVIWGIIMVVGTSGMLALLRAQHALGKSKQALTTVQQMKDDTSTPKQDAYRSPKLALYGEKFVDVYMNVTKENREKRQEELANWYAKGLKVEEIKNVTGYRKLKDKTLYDIESHKGYVVLQYKVVYENITIEKSEEAQPQPDPTQPPLPPKVIEKEKASEHTTILHVPIATKDGKYAVVENPYMTAAEHLQANNIESIQNPIGKKEQVPFTEKQKIEKWLPTFFGKYADSKPEDLTYMMKEPKALSGAKAFVAVQDVKVYKTNEKQTWLVKGNVVWKEREIDLESREGFTMKIVLKEEKYVVETLTHTVGGGKE
ncbi:conjugal transfer protein [Bacillus cereus]|uniref:conjugal transfer protein n=1 Tax=Bacillus cereus TaxID=1396 RepID=UPI003012D0DF